MSAVVAQAAPGITYTITDLGTLGGNFSEALGINNRGDVIGYSALTELMPPPFKSQLYHAFVYSDGQMQDIGILVKDVLRGSESYANAINDRGEVLLIALAIDGNGVQNFLYQDGKVQDFDTLIGNPNPTYRSMPYRLNNRGEVVGSYMNVANMQHAFLYTDGKLQDLGTLGGRSWSYAYGINNRGQVTGYAAINGTSHAYLYSDGKMQDLGAPANGGISQAFDINNRGQVVGNFATSNDGPLLAFLYSDGNMQDLNSFLPPNSGWRLYIATAINDAGQIAGTGVHNGQSRAFLMTPDRHGR